MTRFPTRTAAAVAAALMLGALWGGPLVADDDDLRVERLVFPVSIATGPADVVAFFYSEEDDDDEDEGRVLQVLVHGATYNHAYWDFPTVNGQRYSYARFMAGRGHDVLALDLPGTGESDKPPGQNLRLPEIGDSIRQVIDAMRTGANPLGRRFDTIVLVGHSAGSIASTFTQAVWRPADALVVTASRHLVGDVLNLPITQVVLPQLFQLVAAFAGSPYFFLPPQSRIALFYYAPAADPDVIALDNATADAWTNGQLLTTFFAFLNPAIDQVGLVRGPVLIQLGTNDVLFPADLPEIERALWTSTTPEIQILQGIGHDFNLHLNRKPGWRAIDRWIRDTVGDGDDDEDDDEGPE